MFGIIYQGTHVSSAMKLTPLFLNFTIGMEKIRNKQNDC